MKRWLSKKFWVITVLYLKFEKNEIKGSFGFSEGTKKAIKTFIYKGIIDLRLIGKFTSTCIRSSFFGNSLFAPMIFF